MAIAYRVQMLDKVFAWSELDLTNVEEAIKYSNSALPCCEVDSGQNSCSFYEGSRKTWNISIFKYNYAKQRLASSWDNVLLHSKLSRNSVAYIWIMCYFECGNWHILQIFNVWSLLLVLVQSGFVNWFYWHHVRWGLLEHIGQFAFEFTMSIWSWPKVWSGFESFWSILWPPVSGVCCHHGSDFFTPVCSSYITIGDEGWFGKIDITPAEFVNHCPVLGMQNKIHTSWIYFGVGKSKC